MCISPQNSQWLLRYGYGYSHWKSPHNTAQCSVVGRKNVFVDTTIILINTTPGFLECNNSCTYELHPYSCGNILVLEHLNNGLVIILHLQMYLHYKLDTHSINLDGSDGCCIGFASREFATGPNGKRFDGALVRQVLVFMVDRESCSAERLFLHNHGYELKQSF